MKIILIIASAIIGWLFANGTKSQIIRLIDVFLYGPYLTYLAFKKEELTNFDKSFLIFVGVTTITFNGTNYINQYR